MGNGAVTIWKLQNLTKIVWFPDCNCPFLLTFFLVYKIAQRRESYGTIRRRFDECPECENCFHYTHRRRHTDL